MRRARKDKRRFAFISTFSFLSALALTACAVLFLQKAVYVAMAIFAILSAICYYTSVFSLFLHLDAKTALELLDAMDTSYYGYGSDQLSLAEIADEMCWSKRATKKFIIKCKKRGYLR